MAGGKAGLVMPIKPENRERYPDNWYAISKRIRFERADGRCECTGQCEPETTVEELSDNPRCNAQHASWVLRNGGPENPDLWVEATERTPGAIRVVLTVAHLDHDPSNCDDANLLAMCQRCHLLYDREHHAKSRRETIRARKAAGDLF